MTTPAPSSRQRWLVPVVVVVLSVTVGGGLLAREIYRRPDQPVDDTSVAVSTPSPSTVGAPSAVDDDVRMTDDAKRHPQGDAVRRVLQKYFAAINSKQYQQWVAVVTDERAAGQSQSDWKKGVRTTKDSDALVYRIERASGNSLRVLVGFTSRQSVEDAPLFFREPCIKWRLVIPMEVDGKTLKVAAVDGGPPPEHEKC